MLKIRGNMIDFFDSETIVKVYRMLTKKCEAIDAFIKNHALYFGPCTDECGALDVCNNIIELMTRKNQLINLKIIVDSAVKTLNVEDRKVLTLKMNYTITMDELCGILDLKERTAFRRLDRAISNLTMALNKSKYVGKLERILSNEDWIANIRAQVEEHKMAYRYNALGV